MTNILGLQRIRLKKAYNLPTVNVPLMASRKWLLLLAALAVVGVLVAFLGPGIISPLGMLAIFVAAVWFTVGPLPRFIARIAVSIRWKILAAIALLSVVSIAATVVNTAAMNYMHDELHEILELGPANSSAVIAAIDDLQETQHGPFFSFMPFLSLLAALLALSVGVAIAMSVINPVRTMGQAMRRIASGDFSQPIQVDNNDEFGELANRINDTAQQLARLQEATLAAERARALRERISQVTLAQEEERRRISRELHDGLGPSLAAIGNRLRACQHLVRSDPLQAERDLAEIAKSLKGHVQEIRHLIYDLRPLALDQLGLIEALRQKVERFSQETAIQASLSTPGEVALDPLGEVTVFRVVQECLSNVQKHASASQVEVTLQPINGSLEVVVQDNGRGFDPRVMASSPIGQGVGFLSMRERAELLGGDLSIESAPKSGCQVILRIPTREVEVGAHSNPVG